MQAVGVCDLARSFLFEILFEDVLFSVRWVSWASGSPRPFPELGLGPHRFLLCVSELFKIAFSAWFAFLRAKWKEKRTGLLSEQVLLSEPSSCTTVIFHLRIHFFFLFRYGDVG